ncbi:transcription antitermination factor NusB [candidate division WOR-3 bacterium]|nr:transcription antitermination factor NusB [candidate division WOR-3 bacterium]
MNAKGSRRLGRVLAIQALYPARINLKFSPDFLDKIIGLNGQDYNEDSLSFARTLLNLAEEHLDEADKSIKNVLENWEWDRLCAMDRAILGVAVLELLYLPDVPARVVINEAIEIAKEFSTEKSGIFVNGILDSIAREKGLL